jgi:hypothetical protein
MKKKCSDIFLKDRTMRRNWATGVGVVGMFNVWGQPRQTVLEARSPKLPEQKGLELCGSSVWVPASPMWPPKSKKMEESK